MTRHELRILGVPDLRAPDGRRAASVLSQPSRLSLLAYLTLAPGPVTRASVVAVFWPESDEARARNALSQAVFYLRRSLGMDAVQSVEGDRLWVSPERVWCDARELLTEGQPSAEVLAAACRDPISGWNADGSQPLQEWLDGLRRRVRERVEELGELEALAESVSATAPAQTTDQGAARSPASPGAGSVSTPPPARAIRGPRRPLWIPAAAAAGLAALVLIVLLPPRRPSSDDTTTGGASVAAGASALGDSTATAHLAVLLPRVIGAPEVVALTLNHELLARLPQRAGLELVSAAYASSLPDFLKQLAAIGTSAPGAPIEDMPDWILDVLVVVSDDSVRVVAVLYRGADFGVLGRDDFDQALASPDEMVIQVPRAIAERVAAMVVRVTGG